MMVNYICRTCLYVCDNEFSFRRLEKVKEVLESFVPEIKSFVGKYSSICDQCYYFLKNVEKFKTKCIQTQKKLYSMNIETIEATHNAILQSVANEVPLRDQHPREIQVNLEKLDHLSLKRSHESNLRRANKRTKQDSNIPVTSTVTSDIELTLGSLLKTSVKPLSPPQKQSDQINKTPSNTSVADELLQLLNSDFTDLTHFREFAVKGVNSHGELGETSNNNVSKKINSELVVNYDDEYLTKSDLVSAGILSDDNTKLIDERQTEPKSDDEPEIIEIDLSDNSRSSMENTGIVEFKISAGNKDKKSKKHTTNETIDKGLCDKPASQSIPMTAIVKKETPEDENPGLCQDLHQTTNSPSTKKKGSLIKTEVQENDFTEELTNSQCLAQSCKNDLKMENEISKTEPVTDVGNTLQKIQMNQMPAELTCGSSDLKTEELHYGRDYIFKPRGSWNHDQKSVMLKFFQKHILERKAPKKRECLQLKIESPELFGEKNWVQIKVFVYNTFKKIQLI